MYGVLDYIDIYYSRFARLLSFPAPLWFPHPKEVGRDEDAKGLWETIEQSLKEYNPKGYFMSCWEMLKEE